MYKYLIIGIALIFTLSGVYYINQAGGGELISKVISGNTPTNEIPPSLESVSGTYICSTKSGCTKNYELTLKNDQTAEMVQIDNSNNSSTNNNQLDSSSSNIQQNEDKGTWDLDVQNMLVVSFNGHGDTEYSSPQKLIIKNVGSTALFGIHYTKANYKDMVKPIFVKQEQ